MINRIPSLMLFCKAIAKRQGTGSKTCIEGWALVLVPTTLFVATMNPGLWAGIHGGIFKQRIPLACRLCSRCLPQKFRSFSSALVLGLCCDSLTQWLRPIRNFVLGVVELCSSQPWEQRWNCYATAGSAIQVLFQFCSSCLMVRTGMEIVSDSSSRLSRSFQTWSSTRWFLTTQIHRSFVGWLSLLQMGTSMCRLMEWSFVRHLFRLWVAWSIQVDDENDFNLVLFWTLLGKIAMQCESIATHRCVQNQGKGLWLHNITRSCYVEFLIKRLVHVVAGRMCQKQRVTLWSCGAYLVFRHAT